MVTQLPDITFPRYFVMMFTPVFFRFVQQREIIFVFENDTPDRQTTLLVRSGQGSGPPFERVSQPSDNGRWAFRFGCDMCKTDEEV
jgi:hypothetical protein